MVRALVLYILLHVHEGLEDGQNKARYVDFLRVRILRVELLGQDKTFLSSVDVDIGAPIDLVALSIVVPFFDHTLQHPQVLPHRGGLLSETILHLIPDSLILLLAEFFNQKLLQFGVIKKLLLHILM